MLATLFSAMIYVQPVVTVAPDVAPVAYKVRPYKDLKIRKKRIRPRYL